MELTMNASLNTTASSLDLGTTMDESCHIVASTPLKPLHKELPFRQVTTFGPPPKPTAPKPKTVVRRRTSRTANMLHFPPLTINIVGRRRSMNFKRRMLKMRLDQLQDGRNRRQIRDQQILRRHKSQCQEMVDDCRDSSLDVSNESTPTKRLKTGSLSYGNIVHFQRNSSTRRPRHRKRQTVTLPKSSEMDEPMSVAAASPSLEVDTEPSHKVRKPPSFRFKRFVQKRFGKMFVAKQ